MVRRKVLTFKAMEERHWDAVMECDWPKNPSEELLEAARNELLEFIDVETRWIRPAHAKVHFNQTILPVVVRLCEIGLLMDTIMKDSLPDDPESPF